MCQRIAKMLKKADPEETGYYDTPFYQLVFIDTPFGLLVKMVLLPNKCIWWAL